MAENVLRISTSLDNGAFVFSRKNKNSNVYNIHAQNDIAVGSMKMKVVETEMSISIPKDVCGVITPPFDFVSNNSAIIQGEIVDREGKVKIVIFNFSTVHVCNFK